jgi:hypothetical protein
VVPTIAFRPLYGLLIMGHGRRQILWFGVTAHPTAEWIANQLTEACGWEKIPRYLIRDRDGAYGEIFMRRVRDAVHVPLWTALPLQVDFDLICLASCKHLSGVTQ